MTTLMIFSMFATHGMLPSPAALDFDIRPEPLKAHVRFLASDALEGRDTPSPGLDIAAEYLAAQLELAGVAPGNGDSYFQIASFTNTRKNITGNVKNVIGILRGSDPTLKDKYVLVTAHYDHVGMASTGDDKIFNGANDNASSVAGILEMARQLKSKKHDRSIVFIFFWGEEKGLRGARHYVNNPVLPLKNSTVNINIEQIGRTDDSEGPRVATFNLTGFDFTDLSSDMTEAAKYYGIKVEKHPTLNEPYFQGSDNLEFARAGVPASTISTAYSFPDYHRVGDEWHKLDYNNMAKISSAIAGGVLRVANSKSDVKWNLNHPRTTAFVEAWKKLMGNP